MKHLIALALAATTGLAAASTQDPTVSLSTGYIAGVTRGAVSYDFNEHHFNRYFSVVPEATLGYMRDNATDDHSWEVNINPQFRGYVTPNLYAELGVGIAYFNNPAFASPSINTRFQFSDIAGVGYKLSSKTAVGVRFEHFSNADIRKPNPGVQALELIVSKKF